MIYVPSSHVNDVKPSVNDGSTRGYMWLKIYLSIILDTQLKREVGRQFSMLLLFLFL